MSEAPSLPENKLVDWKPSKFVVVYRFLVEALEKVDSEPCYRISINLPTDDEKKVVSSFCYYNRIYLRQAGFTLKRVERVDGRTERLIHARMFEPGPVDVTTFTGRLPLVVPTFQEGFDQDAFIRKDKNGKITAKPSDACTQTETFTRVGVNGKETDVLKLTIEKDKERGCSSFCRVTQTWVKGNPWWTEATYEWGGGRKYSARLLKE